VAVNLRQITLLNLTDFQNSFVVSFCAKCAIKVILKDFTTL